VLRKGLGGQPLYFFLREGGQIVAGLPGVLLNFRILEILYASIPYGNLIGEQKYFEPFMEALEKELKRRGIDQVRISESPFLKSPSPGSFRSTIAKCTLLDLKKFERGRVWESYRSEIRRAIQKAHKKGLSVRRADRREEMEIFYQLYLSSMERNRAAAKYPRQWFDALYEILIQERKADILFAMEGDRYTAGVVLIYSSTSLHYLHNGSEVAYLENRPNDLIVDFIIQEGVRTGKAILDFMGSGPNDFNLIRFKEKWGSQSMDIHTFVKDYHPLRCKIWETGKKVMNSGIGSWVTRKIRG
jgi:lipid II:glycine glycyltransferase (peptidoglycan interpeptide bridge formation enzyme)